MTKQKSLNVEKEKNVNWCMSAYAVLFIFLLLLLSSIQNLDRKAVIPLIQELVFFCIVFSFSLSICNKGVNTKIFKTQLFAFINVFGVLVLFSSFYSSLPYITVFRALQYIIVSNFLIITLGNVTNLRNLFLVIAKITVSFTLIACLYALLIDEFGIIKNINGATIKEIGIFGFKISQLMYGDRLASFIGNPNPFGLRIMISTILSIYIYQETNKKKYLLFTLILLYTLILTGSRASFLALIVALVVYINIMHIKENTVATAFKITSTVLAILISIYLIFSPETVKFIFSLVGRASHTLSGRELAWVALLEQAKETPLLGIGYRISTEKILEENYIPVSNSHNLYLSILTEVGIIGLLIFLITYVLPVLRLAYGKLSANNSPVKTTAVSILIGLLVNQIFEDAFSPIGFYFVWVTFLLYIVQVEKGR